MREHKKVNAGAQFFQTNLVYDIERMEIWLNELAKRNILDKVFILIGITPLKSLKMARYMTGVPGVFIPAAILQRMEAAEAAGNAQEEGVQIALELARRIKGYEGQGIHGLHIMPVGWEEIVPRIVSEAGLLEETASAVGDSVPRLELRQYRAGTLLVASILLAELRLHHLFLGLHAQQIERDEHDQPGKSGDPVLQEQHLGDDHQPLAEVHRVANDPVDALRDQRVIPVELQRGRPVGLQIAMGAPEDEQRGDQERSPHPAQPRRKMIIREAQPVCGRIEERQEERTDRQEGKQGQFLPGGTLPLSGLTEPCPADTACG